MIEAVAMHTTELDRRCAAVVVDQTYKAASWLKRRRQLLRLRTVPPIEKDSRVKMMTMTAAEGTFTEIKSYFNLRER
jgi:hypothetical protein